MNDFRPCIGIPIYNHGSTIADTVLSLKYLGLPCLIVDDGSDGATKTVLKSILKDFDWVSVIELPQNKGKGAAMKELLRNAATQEFSHVLQVDADGQHNSADAERFLAAGKKNPDVFIIGKPRFGSCVPKSRLWGRQLSRVLVWIETLSLEISDVLCGYRLYPLESTVSVLDEYTLGQRMDFDLDIAVRLYWAGVSAVNIETPVTYPKDGISHFRMVKDNVLITCLHIRLLLGMLVRSPRLLSRSFGYGAKADKEWHKFSERGSLLAFRLILFLHKVLGRKFCSLLVYPIVFYFFLSASSNRVASLEYLRRVHRMEGGPKALKGKPNLWMSFLHFLQFGHSILDKVSVWGGRITLGELVWENAAEFEKLVKEKKGGVLLGAHLGNMEITRGLSERIPGLHVNALMFREHVKILHSGIKELNPKVDLRVVALEDVGVETAIDLRKRLEQGEFVAMLGDRVAVGAPTKVEEVSFLGELASFPQGPFLMANLLECPVYLLFCFRESLTRYHIYFEKFSDKLEFPRQGREERLHAEISRYAKRLENYCLKEPLQWFNFYRFWCSEETGFAEKNAEDRAIEKEDQAVRDGL